MLIPWRLHIGWIIIFPSAPCSRQGEWLLNELKALAVFVSMNNHFMRFGWESKQSNLRDTMSHESAERFSKRKKRLVSPHVCESGLRICEHSGETLRRQTSSIVVKGKSIRRAIRLTGNKKHEKPENSRKNDEKLIISVVALARRLTWQFDRKIVLFACEARRLAVKMSQRIIPACASSDVGRTFQFSDNNVGSSAHLSERCQFQEILNGSSRDFQGKLLGQTRMGLRACCDR